MADVLSSPTLALAAGGAVGGASSKNATTWKAVDGNRCLRFTGVALTMPFCVTVPRSTCASDAAADVVKSTIEGVLETLAGRVFSPFVATSDLQRLNAAPSGAWISVDPHFTAVLYMCHALAKWSGGAFDPVTASSRQADPSLTFTNSIEVRDHQCRRLSESAKADLSAISKGFCVDLLSDQLAEAQRNSATSNGLKEDPPPAAAVLVEWGGDVRAVGRHPSGRPWEVALATPPSIADVVKRLPPPATTAVGALSPAVPTAKVHLQDGAVCTSGSYFGIRDGVDSPEAGKRHLADLKPTPDTGDENDGSLVSVTAVTSTSCALADALATVFAAKRTTSAARHLAQETSVEDGIALSGRSQAETVKRLTAWVGPPSSALVELVPPREGHTSAAEDSRAGQQQLELDIRRSLRARVKLHVALQVSVATEKGPQHLVVMATSFRPLQSATVARGTTATAAGALVASVAAASGTRLERLLHARYDPLRAGDVLPQVTVFGKFVPEEGEDTGSSGNTFFNWVGSEGRIASSDELTDAVSADQFLCSTTLEWAPAAPPVRVGDHAVGWLARPRTMPQLESKAAAATGAVTQLQVKIGNAATSVRVPRRTVDAARPGGLLPVPVHVALVTAWCPTVGGMLASTVTGVELTSRDPPLLTFAAKPASKSQVDHAVFHEGSVGHTLHLLDGGSREGQESTLIDWFADGANARPSDQFMYVQGARTKEAAESYAFDGVNGGRYPRLSLHRLKAVSGGGAEHGHLWSAEVLHAYDASEGPNGKATSATNKDREKLLLWSCL